MNDMQYFFAALFFACIKKQLNLPKMTTIRLPFTRALLSTYLVDEVMGAVALEN
jgi:hypothetical protein